MRAFHFVFLIVLTVAKKLVAPEFDRRTIPAARSFNSRNIDVFSQDLVGPVPFGHIYKEGFGDPASGLKTPVDFLELIMRPPTDRLEAIELLNKTNPEDIQLLLKPSVSFVNPRDKLLKELGILDLQPVVNETKLKWYDLAAIQSKNVANPPSPRPRTLLSNLDTAGHELGKTVGRPDDNNAQLKQTNIFMRDRSFTHPELTVSKENLTTCDEFASKKHFYPKDIIGLDWVPFYIWSMEEYSVAVVHKFNYATKKLVNKYREYYSKYYDSIDWDQPKMLMTGYSEFLLIAENRYGLFHALSLPDIPPNIKDISLPYAKLRMKVVEPYLAMMFCDDLFATVMAVAGNEPLTTKEKHSEAAIVKFRGKGGPVSRDLAEEERQLKAKKYIELEMLERGTIHIHEPIPSMY